MVVRMVPHANRALNIRCPEEGFTGRLQHRTSCLVTPRSRVRHQHCPRSPFRRIHVIRNPLGAEQGHAGPVVALGKMLEGLPRLRVLELSSCTLIGRHRHRYRGLLALSNAFAARKSRLSRLRFVCRRARRTNHEGRKHATCWPSLGR